MEPRVTLLTLGVDNLDRALRFYRDGLGWKTEGIVGTQFERGAVVFFNLQPGLKLGLWERKNLAWDAGIPLQPSSSTEFALAHNVPSKEAVDQLIQQAARAGATILKPPGPAFWGGYAAYFADPDGHLWEIAWNPNF